VALVDYFRAVGEAERIKLQAQLKADALLAEATRAVATPWAAACAAVRRLRDLCDNNAEVAELCGLKLEDVRDMLGASRNEVSPAVDVAETSEPRESGAPSEGRMS
jgi:hypothetical protein